MNKKDISGYIRQIKRRYRGKRKIKKVFIQELTDALLLYCEENPHASYSDLLDRFGSPSDLNGTMDFHSYAYLHKRNMVLYWLGITSVALIVLTIIVRTTVYTIDSYHYSQGFFTEYIEETPGERPVINPKSGLPEPTPIEKITFD